MSSVEYFLERCKVVVEEEDPVGEINIDDQFCINNCNGRGECVAGECQCNDGFMGEDCSVALGEPTTITSVDECCDATDPECYSVVVTGSNIANTEGLSCRITEADVSTLVNFSYTCICFYGFFI